MKQISILLLSTILFTHSVFQADLTIKIDKVPNPQKHTTSFEQEFIQRHINYLGREFKKCLDMPTSSTTNRLDRSECFHKLSREINATEREIHKHRYESDVIKMFCAILKGFEEKAKQQR